jgi:hypothetical protein
MQAIYILLAEANERRQQSSPKTEGGLLGAGAICVDKLPAASDSVEAGRGGVASISPSSSTHHHHHHPSDGGVLEAAAGSEETRPLLASWSPSPHSSVDAGGSAGSVSPQTASSSPAAMLPGLSSAAEVLLYSSLSSLPFIALFFWASGEALGLQGALSEARRELYAGGGAFWPWLVSVAWTETALAGTLVWCTEQNGGLTTSIVGVCGTFLLMLSISF